MKSPRFKIFFFIAISFGITLCKPKDYDSMLNLIYSHSVPFIDSSTLDSLMRHGQSPVLLDIRSHDEFVVSHLEGARLIDYDHFDKNDVEKLPKSMALVLYCAVGYRSEKVGEALLDMGFTNVKNLYGGIFQWKNDGFEVVNNHNLPTDSVHAYNKNWSMWLKNGVKVF